MIHIFTVLLVPSFFVREYNGTNILLNGHLGKDYLVDNYELIDNNMRINSRKIIPFRSPQVTVNSL